MPPRGLVADLQWLVVAGLRWADKSQPPPSPNVDRNRTTKMTTYWTDREARFLESAEDAVHMLKANQHQQRSRAAAYENVSPICAAINSSSSRLQASKFDWAFGKNKCESRFNGDTILEPHWDIEFMRRYDTTPWESSKRKGPSEVQKTRKLPEGRPLKNRAEKSLIVLCTMGRSIESIRFLFVGRSAPFSSLFLSFSSFCHSGLFSRSANPVCGAHGNYTRKLPMTCHGDADIHFTCGEPALTFLSVVPRFARQNAGN